MTSTRAPRRSRATSAALAAPLLAALLLAGCTSGGSSTAGSSGGGDAGSAAFADSAAAPDAASAESAAGAAGAEFQSTAGGASGGELAGDAARQVITTASAYLVTDDVPGTAGRVAVAVEGAGGRVEERSVQTPEGGAPSAHLVLRVPADRLSTTVDDLSRFGDVSDVTVTATDVTAQATDLDARTAALRTSTDRLTAILAGATSTDQVVAAESALTQRQAELDSLTSQRQLLAGQVSMATLSLSLQGQPPAPVVEAGGFLGGLTTGWRGLVGAVGTALVVAGVLLPWLVALALVGAAAAGVVRLGRRVRDRGSAGAPAVAGAPSSPSSGGSDDD